MTAVRSKVCNKASCDLVRSCLCRVDRDVAAHDVIKLLLTDNEPSKRSDRTVARRAKAQAPILRFHIGLHQSLVSESCVIYGCQGDSLLQQIRAGEPTLPRRGDKGEGKKPSAAQLALVLLRLREQLPSFFNGHHDYNLYSSDVRFECSATEQLPVVMVGKQRYILAVETLRHFAWFVWASPKFEIIKITKLKDIAEIHCRWRISGHSRVSFSRRKERVLYDAYSTFTVNCDGLVHQHKLQKVMPQATGIKTRTSWWDYLLSRTTARTTN